MPFVQKTFYFSPEESNVPTFGFILRAGSHEGLYCAPNRMLPSIMDYHNVEMLPFKFVNEKKVFCYLDEAVEDKKEILTRWHYTYLFDGVYGIDGLWIDYAKSIIEYLQSKYDQYESYVESGEK